MTPAPLAVSLCAARLVYSGLTLFDGLDLELTGGCFTCLLGTQRHRQRPALLRLLAGLTAIGISGELRGDDGLPLTGRVAYMAQQDLLLPWLSVLDNVTLGAGCCGERPDRERALQLLTRVGLADCARARPTPCPAGCGSGRRWRGP